MTDTKEMLKHLQAERRLFLFLIIVSAVAMGILFWLIVRDQNHLNAQDREIQHQRYLVQLRDCRDLNKRHDRTLHALAVSRFSSQDIEADKRLIVALVNELVPKRNCLVFARIQVPDGHTP